jgi:2-dehydro-3-deoxyphosphogluconate aldolase/(4S)-4-hydroxy-2-oxoglutarate aldolase
VFPVVSVGGPAYVKLMREPFPDIPLVVSGGIKDTEVAAYLSAGCRGVCLGGALIDREAAGRGDVEAVARHARRVSESVFIATRQGT